MLRDAVAKIPFKLILKSLKPILPIILFTAVLNLFFVSGEGDPLVQFWIFKIYAEGVRYAVLMAVRFGSFSELPANFGGFLFCGVLWGFSFIIPGMTSSSILMAVGLLTPMVDGITHLDLSVLLPWTIGMCGVVALFARLVSKLFDAHYPLAYHAVIGVVLASTLAIIPTGFASSGEMIWSAVCAVLGAVLAALGGKIRPQEETSES